MLPEKATSAQASRALSLETELNREIFYEEHEGRLGILFFFRNSVSLDLAGWCTATAIVATTISGILSVYPWTTRRLIWGKGIRHRVRCYELHLRLDLEWALCQVEPQLYIAPSGCNINGRRKKINLRKLLGAMNYAYNCHA